MKEIIRKKPKIVDLRWVSKTVNHSNIKVIMQNIKDKITAIDLSK